MIVIIVVMMISLEWPGIKTHLYEGTVENCFGQSVRNAVREIKARIQVRDQDASGNEHTVWCGEEKAEKCEGQMRREHKELV